MKDKLKRKEKDSEKTKDERSLKQTGPYLEVSAVKPGVKKIQKKLIVASSSPPKGSLVKEKSELTTNESVSNTPESGGSSVQINDSFIVCSHIADQVDMETLQKIAKKNGIDIEHTKAEQREIEKETRRRIKAWKKCPCRMDFTNCCRDPVTGGPCPVVQAYMTPQPYDPWMTAVTTHLPPGTIGIGRRQVAFHTGGTLPNSNDPHQLEMGRRADGTMCLSVQYAPDPQPMPEYICTTVRETQVTAEKEAKKSQKKSMGGKGSKSKGVKKAKKK